MSYRYRIYPTQEQEATMLEHCKQARYVYNLYVEQMNLAGEMSRTFSSSSILKGNSFRSQWYKQHGKQSPHFTEARKQSPWLLSGSSMVQGIARRDFEASQDRYFKKISGRPTFRKASVHNSFGFGGAAVRESDNSKYVYIRVPKAGYVKVRAHRPLPSDFNASKTVRVSYKGGHWHMIIPSGQPAIQRVKTGNVVGLDLGVVKTVTMSNGSVFDLPTLSHRQMRRFVNLQKKLARQRRGSKKRAATLRSLARLRLRADNIKRENIELLTTELVRQYDLIALENLQITNMTKNISGTVDAPVSGSTAKTALNRGIREQSWGKIRKRLEDKAASTPDDAKTEVIRVNPAYTSQTCSMCGHVDAMSRRTQSSFICTDCGHIDNADVNAAKNILLTAMGAESVSNEADAHVEPTNPSTSEQVSGDGQVMKRELPTNKIRATTKLRNESG